MPRLSCFESGNFGTGSGCHSPTFPFRTFPPDIYTLHQLYSTLVVIPVLDPTSN